MARRGARRGRLAGLCVALVVALPALACRSSETPRHLVILCIDTLRADRVGHLGSPIARTTPVLDRLAASGVTFERAWAASSWTVPSVASLFTSRLPHRHGAGVPGEMKLLGDDSPPGGIRPGLATLAEVLRARGFATASFAANPFLYGRFRDGFEVAVTERVSAAEVVDRGLEWLAGREERRRFLYLHFMDAHEPNHPPPGYFERFATPGNAPTPDDGRWIDPWRSVEDLADPAFLAHRERRQAAYAAAVRYVDDEIGRFLDGLAQLGLREETLIVVTADHGEEFWEHAAIERSWGDDPRGIWGVGHGHAFFEEQLRVPLILAGAGVPASLRSPCAASLIDVAPTAFARLGLEPEAGWQGTDLTGSFRRGDPGCTGRAVFAASSAYGPEGLAIRIGDEKLYRRGGQPDLRFDLARDPGEHRALAADSSPAGRRLLSLAARLEAAGGTGSAAPPLTDPALVEELRTLGYL